MWEIALGKHEKKKEEKRKGLYSLKIKERMVGVDKKFRYMLKLLRKKNN